MLHIMENYDIINNRNFTFVEGFFLSKGNKNPKKTNNNETNGMWKRYNLKWVLFITFWTFLLSMIISVLADLVLRNTPILFAFLILLSIIFIGVMSDMIGIAVTAANVGPFHAMAANKVSGAKYAIRLVKNASTVSNFCNDVIGDICGIVSGVAVASIVIQLPVTPFPFTRTVITIILTGFVASLTVGGKAMGKNVSIDQSQEIVFKTAKLLSFISTKFGVDLIP